MKPAPTNALKPRPKMVRARPVAVWFACSVRVSRANTRDIDKSGGHRSAATASA